MDNFLSRVRDGLAAGSGNPAPADLARLLTLLDRLARRCVDTSDRLYGLAATVGEVQRQLADPALAGRLGEVYVGLLDATAPGDGGDRPHRCPVCGFPSLDEGVWGDCALCGWEDDPGQREDPRTPDGSNGISLDEARRNYEAWFIAKPGRDDGPSPER